MAKALIAEFFQLGQGPLPKMPPIVEQAVTFTTATQSEAFHADTSYIRVVPDADCHVAVGENPTATADSYPLSANQEGWLSVEPGHKISIVTG